MIPVIVVVDPGYVGHEALHEVLGAGYAVTTALGLSELISSAASFELPIVLVPQALAPEPGYALLDALAAHRIEAVGLLIVDGFEGVPVPAGHSGVHAFVPRPFTPQGLACHVAAAANVRARRLADRQLAETLDRDLQTLKKGLRHELRGHLQGVVGLSTLLLDVEESRRAPDDESLDWLRRIAGAGHRLTRLIDHLSDWLALARRPLELTVVDLVELAHEAAAEARSQWPKRHPSVTVIEPAVPAAARVPGDARALAAAVRHLVDNAIRWNSAKVASAEIALVPGVPPGAEAGAPEGWIVRVTDNGPGLPPALYEKVFGMFDKHMHDPEASPGTGMGLAIVRKVAERHGAVAWLEAAPYAGAATGLEAAPYAAPATGLTACLFLPGAE